MEVCKNDSAEGFTAVVQLAPVRDQLLLMKSYYNKRELLHNIKS